MSKEQRQFKLISFLNEESLENLNDLVKKLGIKYVKKHIKKRVGQKINYKKLMETPPGFGDK